MLQPTVGSVNTETGAKAKPITTRRWVYLFEEGSAAMRDLLGGKGAGVAEMTRAGLPTPPGFTITTETCRVYYANGGRVPDDLWPEVAIGIQEIERKTGKGFGSADNPLLVSVRSGAKFSMPGMMDTVLNLGLNEATREGLARLAGDERFAYDAHRRFIQMFGKIVLDIPMERFDLILEEAKRARGAAHDTDLDAAALREVVYEFKRLVEDSTGAPFPSDPVEQLHRAVEAVFRSWNNPRAIAYRQVEKIPHDLGTAVNVQAMVFGNLGWDSGTGVAFTRNPNTGERRLYGEYLRNAQGEDVVAGIRTPQPIDQLRQDMPAVYEEFCCIAERLERHYGDMQDLEFTIERGKLYMLQTRSGKRTAAAAVRIAVEMVEEGLIDRAEAIRRTEPEHVVQLLQPQFEPAARDAAVAAGRRLARGLNASPGAATGLAVFEADRAVELAKSHPVILVRPETNPDDVHGMLSAKGILTARGGATSHAAVVARGLGLPCVAGCEAIEVAADARLFTVDGLTVREGEEISIDGSTGEVFLGAIPTVTPSFDQQRELARLLGWADEVRRLGVWANADYPRDAARAREFGAEGIGLCRTEHMFFEPERLPIVRHMILNADEATRIDERLARLRVQAAGPDRAAAEAARRELAEAERTRQGSAAWRAYHGALERLLEFQREDFKGIFRAMTGLPVVIRLLDPPLHEFLPRYEDLLLQVERARADGADPAALAEPERLLAAVESMREANPMLGLRGCRLGLTHPAINEMQVRAILCAAADVQAEGYDPRPEIMIPLVGHANELRLVREQLEAVARQVEAERGVRIPYRFGTMIEIPRAALTADEIAQHAEFFSFGTNDLTQLVFGYSRDDAEGKFLLDYVQRKILPENPFQTLDREGVGKLMRIAVELGRGARPDLKLGICGEHGGDPASVAFCHGLGLDYVSCSPFRVPVARLAAAQAALAGSPASG